MAREDQQPANDGIDPVRMLFNLISPPLATAVTVVSPSISTAATIRSPIASAAAREPIRRRNEVEPSRSTDSDENSTASLLDQARSDESDSATGSVDPSASRNQNVT